SPPVLDAAVAADLSSKSHLHHPPNALNFAMIGLRMSASIQEASLLSAPQRPPNLRAKERILAAAYDLFSRHRLRAAGSDAIIEKSGVGRMTLSRPFTCKEQRGLAFPE